MERWLQKSAFPDLASLTLDQIQNAMCDILADKNASNLNKSDARKALALLRNLSRQQARLPKISVYLALASFYSIGKKISCKLIFYSGRDEFYLPIQKSFIPIDIECELARMSVDEIYPSDACKPRYSPNLRKIAARKNIKLPT